jgi:hypothetical protein
MKRKCNKTCQSNCSFILIAPKKINHALKSRTFDSHILLYIERSDFTVLTKSSDFIHAIHY